MLATAGRPTAPEVQSVDEEIGAGGPQFATLAITLKPARERGRTSDEFGRDYARRFDAIAGARFSFRRQSDGRIL